MANRLQNTFRARDRESWRKWLAKNHASAEMVWLVFPRKHTGERSVPYEEAVEEALCYGWIDSIIKRIDDATYARKFTPRTDHARWSEANKMRAAKCIQEGKMTEVGLAKIRYSDVEQTPQPSIPKVMEIPGFMKRALNQNLLARQSFYGLPPSERRKYILWLTMAKREETRKKRLKEALRLLAKNNRLGLK